MKILYRNEYIFVSRGATGCKDCDDMELEKECRDDLNTGFAMGAAVGALVSKNPVGIGVASLVGGRRQISCCAPLRIKDGKRVYA